MELFTTSIVVSQNVIFSDKKTSQIILIVYNNGNKKSGATVELLSRTLVTRFIVTRIFFIFWGVESEVIDLWSGEGHYTGGR